MDHTYTTLCLIFLLSIVALDVHAQPANSTVANATKITELPLFDSNVNVPLGEKSNGDGAVGCVFNCCETVAYKFTPSTSGDVTGTISAPSGIHAIIFYTAADENAADGYELVHLNQAGNTCGVASSTTVNVTAGQTYYVLVGNEISTTIQFTGNATLPVELTSFTAFADGETIRLNWKTASETNNHGFEVQHKTASDAFEPLGFIEGHGTTTTPQEYTYPIHDLAAGKHTFRLKQVDADGSFAYSSEVETAIELANTFELSEAYPNPFNPSTHLTLTLQQRQHVRVEVFDVLGHRVAILHEGILPANEAHRFTFEATGLPSGLFIIRAMGEQFVADQKVTLMK